MPGPTSIPLLGIQGYFWFWLISVVAVGLFSFRVARHVKVLLRGRNEIRWDRIPERLRLLAVNVLGQRRLFNEPVFGIAHFFIFWAFVFYAASFWWNLLKGLVPALPIPWSDEVLFMSVPMEVLGGIALLGLVIAGLRRYVFTPPDLERTWDASLILVLIAALLLTFMAGQGFRAMEEHPTVAESPLGVPLARAFTAMGVAEGSAVPWFLTMWWLHMAIVLGVLAYVPYSKHVHLVVAPFGVLFSSLRPGGMPATSEGASRLTEFTWRQLLNALTCAECGRCDRVCPAHKSGYPLSPKRLIHHLKEIVLAPDATGNGGGEEPDGRKFVGEVVKHEELWACTTCHSCMTRCPVFNEHIPLIVEMRRHLMAGGEVEPQMQDTLTNLTRYGNSLGKSPRARAKWIKGLDFKPKDARKEAAEYLWFLGDYASFDPRTQPATRALARVLREAGVDYGLLYEAEHNSGNDVRRMGEEGLFEMLRDKNLEALGKAEYGTIVTTDPHTYHALKHEYAENGTSGGENVRVLHYTELLDDLLRAGNLPVNKGPATPVTYHDPCYLGRYNGIYDAPRRVLSAMGFAVKEMPRNRDESYCCGAGGGRIWMEDAPGIEERPAESRVKEAAALPGVETLVVACPKDLVMFQDAVKTAGLEGRMVIKDIVELVEERLSERRRSEADEAAAA